MKGSLKGCLALFVAAGLWSATALCAGPDPSSWSYTGNTGPAKWGKMAKEFAVCGTGELQSPIDIPDAHVRKGDIPAMLFNYKPSPLRIVDDGHTIRVNYAPGSYVNNNGKRYDLVAIEFHKPGEEKVNGKGHEMSAHLIHTDKDNKVAIIAVLLDQGAENPVLKTLWSNLPSTKNKESVVDSVTINAVGLLPKHKGYYTYTGSLTAPPCTEGVTWFVMQEPVPVSADQIARFGRLYPENARPIQPRNDRDILGSP
jgi:carbonic anhydrase